METTETDDFHELFHAAGYGRPPWETPGGFVRMEARTELVRRFAWAVPVGARIVEGFKLRGEP